MRIHLLALLLIPFTALAQPDAEDVVQYRKAVYQVMKWNFTELGAMAREKRPYDAVEFARRAERLAQTVRLLDEAYTPGSITADSAASDRIWTEWEDFQSRLKALRQETAQLAAVAKSGELEPIQEQFAATGQVCKGCHDEYKED